MKESSTYPVSSTRTIHQGNHVMDEGGLLFIEVFWLLSAKGMIEFRTSQFSETKKGQLDISLLSVKNTLPPVKELCQRSLRESIIHKNIRNRENKSDDNTKNQIEMNSLDKSKIFLSVSCHSHRPKCAFKDQRNM